jgi:hypothetical protein
MLRSAIIAIISGIMVGAMIWLLSSLGDDTSSERLF